MIGLVGQMGSDVVDVPRRNVCRCDVVSLLRQPECVRAGTRRTIQNAQVAFEEFIEVMAGRDKLDPARLIGRDAIFFFIVFIIVYNVLAHWDTFFLRLKTILGIILLELKIRSELLTRNYLRVMNLLQ